MPKLPQEEIDRRRPYGEPVPFVAPRVVRRPLWQVEDREIAAVRLAVGEALGHDPRRFLACHDLSFGLARLYAGARAEGGRFIGPRGPGERWGKRGGPHTWVRLEDGSILDASADQYGHPAVLRLALRDPRQTWYEVHPPVILTDGTWNFPRYKGVGPFIPMRPVA